MCVTFWMIWDRSDGVIVVVGMLSTLLLFDSLVNVDENGHDDDDDDDDDVVLLEDDAVVEFNE